MVKPETVVNAGENFMVSLTTLSLSFNVLVQDLILLKVL